MVAIISLLVIVTLSIVITRVATVMLTATGLARDVARFQARSALTGTGFTTSESELVVNQPVRRRIILQLMLLGAAGIVTSLTSLLLSFTDASGGQTARRLIILVVGLVAVRLLAGSRVVDRALVRLTEWALRRFTTLDVRDYARLLDVSGDYTVAELDLSDDHWMVGRQLEDVRVRDEGLIVLGVRRRDGSYLGVPAGPTLIDSRDQLVLYGRSTLVDAMAERQLGPEGDAAHERAALAYQDIRAHAQDEPEPAERDAAADNPSTTDGALRQ